jgi:hypothetical protein
VKEEITNPPTLVNLITNDYNIVFELFLFATNIKKEVCGVLESFFYFLSRYEKTNYHNMICLTLYLKIFIQYFFVGHEEGVNIVKEYDKQLLYPMLLKCYHNLHPMAESKVGHVDQKTLVTIVQPPTIMLALLVWVKQGTKLVSRSH